MTYREKMMLDHPEEIDQECCGGVCGCPSDYYGVDHEFPCYGTKGKSLKDLEEACTECWNREYPDMAQDNKHKPTTNGDRIRAMSDEELAEFIGHSRLCDRIQQGSSWCEEHAICRGCLVEWLRQPVREE